MNKDKTNREKFVKKAVENPKEAAADLRKMASSLESSNNTTEVVENLSNILHLSERTIYYDYCKDDISSSE